MVDKITNMQINILKLFRADYIRQIHVREMAKLTAKSHVTLLPHLRSLQKNAILLSHTVGKNKYFSLNLDSITAKKYVQLAEIVETITLFEEVFLIKKIAHEIFNLHLDGTIVVFGSYSKKTFQHHSDLDIFYIGNLQATQLLRIKHIGKMYGKIIRVKKTTLRNFESGLRKKDPLLIEIVKNHIILQNHEPFINSLWRFYREKR